MNSSISNIKYQNYPYKTNDSVVYHKSFILNKNKIEKKLTNWSSDTTRYNEQQQWTIMTSLLRWIIPLLYRNNTRNRWALRCRRLFPLCVCALVPLQFDVAFQQPPTKIEFQCHHEYAMRQHNRWMGNKRYSRLKQSEEKLTFVSMHFRMQPFYFLFLYA